MIFKRSSKQQGQAAEDAGTQFLKKQGLTLVAKNYQPVGRGVADLDIVMQDQDNTLVFVEVRMRSSTQYGGGAASIDIHKQRRLIKAAQHFLMQFAQIPNCRFDVLIFEEGIKKPPLWFKAAFDVSE